MKRNIVIAVLSLVVVLLASLYSEEKTWHDLVQNGMTLECYGNLEMAMGPLTNSNNPVGYDELLTENAVNKVVDDFLVKSVRGNEPESIKVAVHNALAKLAVAETNTLSDRAGRAADARETIEEAIEVDFRH